MNRRPFVHAADDTPAVFMTAHTSAAAKQSFFFKADARLLLYTCPFL
jgi:hypothetical protein